jgi:sugar phosphate permease
MISFLFTFLGILPAGIFYWDDMIVMSSLSSEPWIWLTSKSIYYCSLMFFYGFALNGPKTLVILAVQKLAPKDLRGSVSGVCGLVGQAGAVLAGYCLGTVIESYGWNAYLLSMFLSMGLLALLLLISLLLNQVNEFNLLI